MRLQQEQVGLDQLEDYLQEQGVKRRVESEPDAKLMKAG